MMSERIFPLTASSVHFLSGSSCRYSFEVLMTDSISVLPKYLPYTCCTPPPSRVARRTKYPNLLDVHSLSVFFIRHPGKPRRDTPSGQLPVRGVVRRIREVPEELQGGSRQRQFAGDSGLRHGEAHNRPVGREHDKGETAQSLLPVSRGKGVLRLRPPFRPFLVRDDKEDADLREIRALQHNGTSRACLPILRTGFL